MENGGLRAAAWDPVPQEECVPRRPVDTANCEGILEPQNCRARASRMRDELPARRFLPSFLLFILTEYSDFSHPTERPAFLPGS